MVKTPVEMISILPDDDFNLANQFVKLGEKLNCMSKVRFAPAHKSWKCVFSTKKPSRVLFTIECTHDKWHIKACLWHIDAYRDCFDTCSNNIKETITGAYDCKSCNLHCGGGAAFTLNGVVYKKCVGCSFYFIHLDCYDCQSLLTLIEKEYAATNT